MNRNRILSLISMISLAIYMLGTPTQAALAAKALPQLAGSVKYVVTGISLGGNISRITAINAIGQAAGWGKNRAGSTHAFRYSNGITTDLGTLPGGGNSEAWDINDSGQVVGWSYTSGNTLKHAFLYSGGVMIDLGTLCSGIPPVCGTESEAIAINASGQIAGTSNTPDGKRHAFRYTNGVMTDLGTLGGDVSGASGINDSGVVIGYSYITPGPYSTNRGFVYQSGGMVNVGTFGGSGSRSIDINNSGQVCGVASVSTNEASRAFLFTGSDTNNLGLLPDDLNGDTTPQSMATAINESGQVVGQAITSHNQWLAFSSGAVGLSSLGSLGGSSKALDINNSGQIVGYSFSSQYNPEAFVYNSRILSNLNTLIDQTAGITLQEADLINDAGMIATYGLPGNRAYLLTPISGPYISLLSPTSATAGGEDFTLVLAGLNLHDNSIIQWDGAELVTSYVSNTFLTAAVPAEKISAAGVHTVNVFNPTSDPGISNDKFIFVTYAGVAILAANSATSTDSAGTAAVSLGGGDPGTPGSLSASASGAGTVVVGSYSANPGGAPGFSSAGRFIDIFIKPGSAFTSLSILDCNLNNGNLLYWWNGSVWLAASDQTYNFATRCVTVTVNNITTPSLSDLTGTPFGSGSSGFKSFLPLTFR